MTDRVPVTFAPSGATVEVEPGIVLAEAARRAGLLLATPCAGRGVCGGCAVRVLSGALQDPDDAEASVLTRAPHDVRLACRARVSGAVRVEPLFDAMLIETGGGLDRGAAPSATTEATTAAGLPLVVGVDLGTTSVGALVVDADTGRELARTAGPNRQRAYGADVLSRISAVQAGKGEELQRAAAASISAVLGDALADCRSGELKRLVIAGNSAMMSLLEGADVASLAAHPFTPPVAGGTASSRLRELLGVGATTEIVLVPPIAAFVGGDALAATVSAGLVDTEVPVLLVDIGTNAEIVLARREGLLVTSTAAGPAFEGAGISCGGPVGLGAVQRLRLHGGEVDLETIGGEPPRWFSGAGFVSAVSALVAAGHITPDGRMLAEGPLEGRFRTDDAGVARIDLSESGDGSMALSQLDVRELQLAKAAVRVGIESLLQAAGLHASELSEVLVAGAFGAALEPVDLQALGTLPSGGVAVRRIGNAALEGAAGFALDPGLLALAEKAAAAARHVDLATDSGFSAAFVVATEFAPYSD